MKLHLPTGLRAALIAAITAIGFTLTQAYAAETQLTVNPTERAGGNTNISWTGGESTLNSWKLTFDLTVTNGNSNDFFNISSNNGTAQAGWALGTNGSDLRLAISGKNGTPAITLSNAFTIGTAQSVTFQFVRNVDEGGASLGTGTFTIIAGGETATYDVTNLDDTALVSGSRGHIWCNGNPSGQHQLAGITLYQLDDKEVVVPSNMWIGTEGNNTWVASNFNPAFTTGADVKFTATGYKTVVVNSNVEAGKMTVTGAAYTFNIQEGATLKAQGLTLSGTGATATLDGSGKYELNSGVDTMGGMAFADTWIGTVKLSNITTQQLDLNNYGTAKSVVEIDGWSKFLKNSNGYVYNPKLRLTGSGMTIQDGYSNFSYEFAGGVEGEGDFKIGITTSANNQTYIFTGDVASWTGSYDSQRDKTTTLKFYNKATEMGAAIKQTSGVINIEVGNGTAEFATVFDKEVTAKSLTIKDKATATLKGATTIENVTGEGSLIVNAEANTVTFTGNANVISNTITLTSGTLNVSGAVLDISDIAISGGSTTYSGGQNPNNGFASISGIIDVVNVGGNTFTHEGTRVLYNGAEVTMNDDGDVEMTGTKSLTTFYVNESGTTESLANAVTNGEGQLTTVIMKDNTKLLGDAETSLTALTVTENASAEVELTKALTVDTLTITSDNKVFTLSGTGDITTGSLTGAGDLVYSSTGVMTLNGSNTSFTGDVTISNGTLKIGNQKALGEHGNGANTKVITIAEGGTLDLNGITDANFKYTMSGGTLTNSGAALGASSSQTTGLTLTKDSTVHADTGHDLRLLARGYAVTDLDLAGKTLYKTGSGLFQLKNTTVTDGVIEVQGGELNFDGGSSAADITFNGGAVTGTMKLSGDVTLTAQKAGSIAAINADSHAITFNGESELTVGGAISNATSLTKDGEGTVVIASAIANTPAIEVKTGTLKATVANALGSGAVTVDNGATLELTIGNALGGTQTVSNSGNVLIHNTLTSGKIDGGVLTLAGDFPVDGGGLEDVDGATTGNGFSQGGVMHVYTPATAELTGGVKVMKGDTDYTSQMDANGDITMSGADWTTYQLNVENEDQPTIKQIIDYASSKGSALASIVVNGAGLALVDDTTTFKTSMLSGSELASLDLTLVDEAVLTMDADLAGNLSLGGLTGDASATIVLEKDVAAQKSLWLYNMEGGGISTLTIKGAHTITTPLLGTMFGKFVLQEGAKLAVAETGFGMTAGDSIEIQDAAELDLGKVSIKSVDGTKAATMMNESDEDAYDIGSTRYSLTDACVTISYSDTAHNFGHELKGTSSLVNAGTSSVNDINALNTTYDELHAQNGDIYLSGRTSGVTVRNLTVGEGHGVYMNGSDETITVNGTATFGDGAKVSSALTMAAGSTLDGIASLESHALTLEDGINIGDDLWSTISALAAQGSINIFTGVSALTLAGAEYSEDVDLNTIFTHASLKPNKYMLGFKDGNVVITKNLENNRYWKGGSGTWNYSTTAPLAWTDEEGGADAAFVNGYNAHFTSASGGVITLGEDITAASVYVSGADYTFAPNGHTLTVTNGFEVDGHTAMLQGLGLSGANLKLTAKNGGELELGANSSVKDVEIGSGSAITVDGSTLAVAGSLVNNGSLYAEMLILSQGTAQGGNVEVGSLNLADNQSYTFGNLNAATISGTGADLTISNGGTLSATATLKSLATGDSAQLGGNITVAGATNAGGGTTISGSLTTATLTGGPILVADGDLTLTSNGSLGNVLFSGSSSLTASGTTTVALGASLVNSDALTLKGRFDASNLGTSKSDSKYVEGGTPGNGNGFEQARLTLTIVNGGTTSAGEATILYRGKALTEKVGTDGTVTFDGDVDYTKFYVNSGTENASKALDNARQQLGTFELKAGTTLVVDKNISMGMVNAAGAATMQIDAGSTVNTDGTTKNLTLTGGGTLAVDAGKTSTGVTLGGTWTGTVSYTEAQLTTLGGSWKSGSTVSLTGVTGSLGSDLIEGKVVLKKGTGDWGFGQTETSGTQYTNLENTLTGDGNLGVKSGSVDSTFNLNGDIDGWTGNFIVATDADTDLNLGGSGPKTVHGTVGGSNLTVNVNADTTFESALSVAEINVNDSKTATLKADSTADRVDTYSGSLKVDNGKTLTVTGFTGPEGLKLGAGASIVLQGTAYMGGEDYGYVGGTVANKEGTDQDVTIHNANITVTDTTLRVNGGSGFTVDNKLVNATLAVENGLPSTVTLNNVQDSLEVAGDLEIGPGGLLKVAQNNGTAKQTLNISDGTTLTLANDTTLDADLTLNRGVTLKLDYNMGTPVATSLNGGGLTLYKGLTLSGDLYETLKGLSTEGASVTLFSNVDTIVFDGATSPTVDASAYFTNLMDQEGDFTFNYEGGALSIVFSEATSRQLVWDGTETEHRWVAYEPEAIDPEVKDWYQPSTETETHFAQGDIATFGADADVKVVNLSAGETTAKRVTIKDAADYEFVADAAGSKLSANRFEVKEGATLSKSGAGTLILEVGENVTVDAAGLFVDEGELVIGTAEMPGTLALDNGVMEVAEGATLRVAKIQDSEGSLIAVCGTLNVASGSLHAIHTTESSTLVISNVNGVAAGTLSIDSDTTLLTLENHGTLDVGTHSLTLTEAAVQGGNVTAGSLHLGEFGSTFGDVTTDTVHFAYGMLDVVDPNVAVDTIVSNAGAIITLDLTEALTDSGCLSPMHRQDMPTTYTLIHAEDGLGTTSFTLGETLGLLVQNGLIHEGEGLTMTEKDVKITVGGQSLIWYTDKDVTEWGYQVVSGDALTAGGNTLNGVEHVVVDASRRIDVTGAGSAPGLRVRNITGLDGRTITFTGTEEDTVNLITSEETSSNVNVAAENITLKVGLDELDEMDPVDYKDLRVGDVNLTSATLDVHDHEGLDDSFTVNSLNGDSGSVLKGTLIVEGQGGTYNGGYEDATVILHKDADQALAAGRGLTVMGLGLARITYSGTETHMDGIEGIGLRVMLNDVETDNSHRTLTLDNEYSYIVDGALGVGLSAIESGITLDSEAAPDLLRAEHLDMSGSTLYIYQPASDGATLTMDVNDGGYKRGLLLANLGADDTTADAVQLIGDLYNKYYQNARLQNGRVLVDRRTDYFSSITEPTSENGRAGAGMLDDALLYNNPQATQAGGDLAVVMTALELGGYPHGHADRVMAAMSGASQAAMGAAWNRDVDRQLRAIRNRTTQMGLAECTHHEGLPYFNAWINAEGDYTKLSGDGTLAGYKLSSWGGTVGVDVDCTARFTMGAAVTAMSGDFTAESADQAEGDLDRLYVSVFGRYTRRAWTHTLVATFGMADTKLKRTVNYDYGSYNTESSSDGKAFGVMYEVGYVAALNEDASTCLQPVLNLSYRHSSLGGSTEQSASDAALRLGDVDADVFTAAIGARLQSAVGTSVYNRSSIFEGRVMLKFDAGDRDTTASNGFIGVPGSRSTKSTEAGMFGVEVGAGLTIPLSENAGALFFDVTGDFRAKDTEFNGTVGYRYNF